jgi:large conductance mechanosensitive channel
MRKLAGEFRDFLLMGNLIALATAVIMGTVFAALIKALITDLLTPIIALIAGKPNFGNLSFTLHHSHFLYGDFINYLITFIITGVAVFFFIVKPYGRFAKKEEAVSTRECPECLSEIPIKATRCAFCTAEIGPAVA